MDNWLKGLIAAACLVIIASGGYFALQELEKYQINQSAVAKQLGDDRRKDCISNISTLESVKPTELMNQCVIDFPSLTPLLTSRIARAKSTDFARQTAVERQAKIDQFGMMEKSASPGDKDCYITVRKIETADKSNVAISVAERENMMNLIKSCVDRKVFDASLANAVLRPI